MLPRDDNRCTHLTPKGNRCRKACIPGKPLCFLHSREAPLTAAAHRILKRRVSLDTVEGIHFLVSNTVRALAEGHIPPRRATAIAYLAQVLLTTVDRIGNERQKMLVQEESAALQIRNYLDAELDRKLGIRQPGDDDARDPAPPM